MTIMFQLMTTDHQIFSKILILLDRGFLFQQQLIETMTHHIKILGFLRVNYKISKLS